MALPISGALSISQIKTELGSASNSLRTLSGLAGFSTPDAISEFYGYSSLTAITLSEIGFNDTEQGCSEGSTGETLSYYSSTDPVAVYSYIYDNNRDIFNGNNQWFYYPSGTKLIQIAEDGKVTDTYSCE
jgi:hypothetical protein